MTTTIQLSELTNRQKVDRMIHDFREEVVEGFINALDAAIILKAMEDFTKVLRADAEVKDAVKIALDRFNEKVIHYNGCVITKKQVGVKYVYDNCNDPVYNRLKTRRDIADALVKEREEFLKTLPDGGMTVVDDETGEVYQIFRAEKTGEEGYMISYSK